MGSLGGGPSAAFPVVQSLAKRMGLSPPGRAIEVWQDDIFLTSYPRSGNTWLRFMIASLLRQTPASLNASEVQEAVPDIYKVPEWKLRRAKSPRILKSHEPLDARYKNVIYVLRDPRDVALSYFAYQKKLGLIPPDMKMDDFTTSFVKGDVSGYGTWGNHVASWTAREGESNLMILRYEDMHRDPHSALRKVADHISLRAEKDRISKAVEASDLERMTHLQKESPSRLEAWSRAALVNRGHVGAWRTDMDESAASRIVLAFGDMMEAHGYLPEQT